MSFESQPKKALTNKTENDTQAQTPLPTQPVVGIELGDWTDFSSCSV